METKLKTFKELYANDPEKNEIEKIREKRSLSAKIAMGLTDLRRGTGLTQKELSVITGW